MIPSFRIGGDTGIESPEAIKRQRAVALALLKQASDTSPTDMYGGIARVGQGVISALMNRRADKSEKRGQDDANQKFNAILGSLMGPQASPSPVGAETVNPTPYEMQGIPDPRSPEFTIQDDRNLPIVGGPGMIHAAPQGQQPQQAQPQPQPQPQGNNFEAAAQEVDALPMDEIMALMDNPYLTEAQGRILNQVVQSKFDRGEWLNAGQGVIFNTKTGERKRVAERPSDIQVIQDRSTGEIIAIDRNDPNAQPRVIRQGGLSQTAQAEGEVTAAQPQAVPAPNGPPAAPAPDSKTQTLPRLTEQQSKDLVYYQRGSSALENLNRIEGALTSYQDSLLDSVPVVRNSLTSEEYQLANQAGREFLAAILRKDTGAAITAQEMDVYGRMYLPQPGEPQAVLDQKREARQIALEAIKTGLGAASRALPEPQPGQRPPPVQINGYTIEQVD